MVMFGSPRISYPGEAGTAAASAKEDEQGEQCSEDGCCCDTSGDTSNLRS